MQLFKSQAADWLNTVSAVDNRGVRRNRISKRGKRLCVRETERHRYTILAIEAETTTIKITIHRRKRRRHEERSDNVLEDRE